MTKKDDSLSGKTHRKKTPCGNLYITIARNDEGQIDSIFGNGAKSGTCARCMVEAISRVATMAIAKERKMVKPADVVKTLKGISCPNSNNEDEYSCPTAVAIALEMDEEVANKKE